LPPTRFTLPTRAHRCPPGRCPNLAKLHGPEFAEERKNQAFIDEHVLEAALAELGQST